MSDTPERNYYIDPQQVEHACCWSSAIVRKCLLGTGQYGSDVQLVCECRAEDAATICAALNAALEVQE